MPSVGGAVQAVLVGGYHGTWLPAAEAAGLPLANEALRPLGAAVGAGVLAALPADRCGLAETARVARYLALESAGQCGPCFNGLPRIAAALEHLAGPRPDSRARAELPHVCVLFLTARDAVEDRVAGITAGGDDYVTKPFSLEEVLARLRGLLRRAGVARARAGTELSVADLTMDEDAREVRRGGDLIELTATEFELLRFLMRNPRRVLSKAQILDRVWNYDFGGQAHVVELYISYLRKKIDAGRDPLIHTVRGVGYVLKPAG